MEDVRAEAGEITEEENEILSKEKKNYPSVLIIAESEYVNISSHFTIRAI